MDLLNRFPEVEGRTEVIPVGIDDRFFKHQDKEHMRQVRERHQLPKHFLLFVGQLETKKNIPALIRSYTRLRAQHETDVKLVIAGNRGWGARAIDDAYEASLFQEDIQFTGFIPDTDLPALMCQAEAFVFPSLYEGFGMPPLEAMACGTPVITSDAGALPEVVDDAALTVDPRDDAALADAVEAVLTDRKLAADLVKKGRERARCFQWKGIAAATEEFYTHI